MLLSRSSFRKLTLTSASWLTKVKWREMQQLYSSSTQSQRKLEMQRIDKELWMRLVSNSSSMNAQYTVKMASRIQYLLKIKSKDTLRHQNLCYKKMLVIFKEMH